MTKEEKIQEAYGDYFEQMKPWIEEEGWFNKNAFYQEEFKFKYQDLDMFFIHLGDFMIPKSIHGITGNNGWIKIESEEDFPKENGDYFICVDGVQPNNNIMHLYQLISHCRDGLISHYKPVIKPNEPIY